MRTMFLVLACGFAFSTAAMAGDPQSNASIVTAAPEPMAHSETVPQAVHTDMQGTAESAAATPDSEKLICHHPVHEGTILPQQVCLTKHAWELIRLREQKNVSDFQRRAYQTKMK